MVVMAGTALRIINGVLSAGTSLNAASGVGLVPHGGSIGFIKYSLILPVNTAMLPAI